jgi:hypothetical protein
VLLRNLHHTTIGSWFLLHSDYNLQSSLLEEGKDIRKGRRCSECLQGDVQGHDKKAQNRWVCVVRSSLAVSLFLNLQFQELALSRFVSQMQKYQILVNLVVTTIAST